MITVHIVDLRGVYLRTLNADPMGPQPTGAVYAQLPEAIEGFTRMWINGAWHQVLDADVPPLPEPVQPVPAAPDLRITKLAFRNRFMQAEKVSIELAAADDPSAPMAQRQLSATVRAYLADLNAASFIDLAREDLQDGVESLEAASLIGVGRAAEILSNEIDDIERYRV